MTDASALAEMSTRVATIATHVGVSSDVGADDLQSADSFEATIGWIGAAPLLPGRSYDLHLGDQLVAAAVQRPKFRIDESTREHLPGRTLATGQLGVCALTTDARIVFRPFVHDQTAGAFTLADRVSGEVVATGVIHFALRRSQNVHWQALDIDRDARAQLKAQRPVLLWFTGLSGSGKSTIANLVEKRLHALGKHTFLLDGDNVRHGLNRDLGFTDADRVENIRRVGEVARLMTDAGLIVLAAFISPFRAERRMVRERLEDGEFIEVFVDTPLDEAERRDVKGLYKKARAGELKNFTGIDSPYEPPEHAEIRIDTTSLSAEDAAELIVARVLAGHIA
jgi:bifunctional enzyme CysN/CysC